MFWGFQESPCARLAGFLDLPYMSSYACRTFGNGSVQTSPNLRFLLSVLSQLGNGEVITLANFPLPITWVKMNFFYANDFSGMNIFPFFIFLCYWSHKYKVKQEKRGIGEQSWCGILKQQQNWCVPSCKQSLLWNFEEEEEASSSLVRVVGSFLVEFTNSRWILWGKENDKQATEWIDLANRLTWHH